MTRKNIEAKQMKSNVPYELAKQIRALLDDARKAYGPSDWDDDDVENIVFELVTESDS